MAAGSKREAVAANEKIRAAMEDFTQQYPDWVQQLNQIAEYSDDGIPEEMKPILTSLTKLLSVACTEIKHRAIEETEFFKFFPQKLHPFVQKLIEPRLRVFHAFAPLCALYGENHAKAENIIDQIWQQYVIRFNPYRKIERPNNMTDADMSNLENALNAFAEYCGVRMLHYDAIIRRIKQEAALPNGLCAYIARKVDKDYQEIRMNYIISRLEDLESRDDDPEQ